MAVQKSITLNDLNVNLLLCPPCYVYYDNSRTLQGNRNVRLKQFVCVSASDLVNESVSQWVGLYTNEVNAPQVAIFLPIFTKHDVE